VDVRSPRERHRHYAAQPGEHVAQPSVFTTLLPHVNHSVVHEFRYAFLLGLVAIVILVATGLVIAALLAAIFLAPVLYLVYLYESQVYRDEPAFVLGVTLIGGVALGLLVTIVAERLIGPTTGRSTPALLAYTVVLPIVQLIVLPIPALIIRARGGFIETVDGLVFGVAAGLGFSVAEQIVRFSNVFSSLGIHTDSAGWIYPLASVAVLVPLLHGSAAGAIAAALWRTRTGSAARIAPYGIPLAVVASVAFYYVAQVLQNNGVAPLIVLLFQAVPIGLLLIYIRFLLHYSLLDEARDLGFNSLVCPNCHRHVMAAGFCPHCGVALSANPRRGVAAAAPAATGEHA